MEFKVEWNWLRKHTNPVLIESDWNLKVVEPPPTFVGIMVLIESDWNLKEGEKGIFSRSNTVLIESDWNLKERQTEKRKEVHEY